MPEYLDKLRPDRDLQCYFERPSGIAALSGASASGFTVSGTWRQQFDWAVLEWNRDNVFEHPAFRYLPDGDLSGLVLTYDEERGNCIEMDSTWYPTVDWPWLRVWAAETDGVERLYRVPLLEHANALEGGWAGAAAQFELTGTVTALDYVELAWLGEHFTYQLYAGDALETAIAALATAVNARHALDPGAYPMTATGEGRVITLRWPAAAGSNGNRIGVYGNVSGAGTEAWSPARQRLLGGASPTKWRVSLDFGALQGYVGPAFTTLETVPTNSVRKMRWTWAAAVQSGNFARSEFSVKVQNWTVTGAGRRYKVAGPASRRVEDDSPELTYTGTWAADRGNYSGGSIRYTSGGSVTLSYRHQYSHTLYLGALRGAACGTVSVTVDGGTAHQHTLMLDENVLVRVRLAELAGQVPHTVTVSSSGGQFYFDFFEMAVPVEELPVLPADPQMNLATDWDTDHSLALAPERTAWMIDSLGFRGRANHYVGALWFYELVRDGHEYASATVTFSGSPEFSVTTQLVLGPTTLSHLNLIGDTAESIAKAFEFEINGGSTALWAEADAGVLTLHARRMGAAGNGLTVQAITNSQQFTATVSGPLAGGVDGTWHTDMVSEPPLNRAARDWSSSFFSAMHARGLTVTTAFSMELGHGDTGTQAGIAQRYPSGDAVWLNTPALQTNFSPASRNYWKKVHLCAADLMAAAGLTPYLQFGEVQWWYFPQAGSGMPFYDAYTTARFQSEYGRALPVFVDGSVNPAEYPQECAHLSGLIGEFTSAVAAWVLSEHPAAKFEVLYAPDVNEAPLNGAVNLPAAWSPENLEWFKTENFTYTYGRDLNKARSSIALPLGRGFPRNRCAHLVGVGEYTTPWERESLLAKGENVESVVLFALDQYCLIGHRKPGSIQARSLLLG